MVSGLQFVRLQMGVSNSQTGGPGGTATVHRRTHRLGRWLGLALSCLLVTAAAGTAVAEPLDLFDPSPRAIAVSFEISPRDQPASVQSVYSPGYRAFVEPGRRASEMRVVIPAKTVEAVLLGDQDPIPESFSDFVWTFDVETGHVVSAHLRGLVTPELDWGFMKTRARAEILIEMGTTGRGGFKDPRRVLGNLVFGYCTSAGDPGCQLVEPTPYDPLTGYVNAVGQVWVRSSVVDVWNFSPLGEAIFSELGAPGDVFEARKSGVELSLPAAAEPVPSVSTPGPGNVGTREEHEPLEGLNAALQ